MKIRSDAERVRAFREADPMDLIKCPRCGEMYSSSYRRCPFCEEEDRPRRVASKRGHYGAERKKTHSARGPFIAVLLVVLVILSWYLFGEKFMERIADGPKDPVENVDPLPVDPAPGTPDGSDPAADPSTDTDTPAPPVVDDPTPPADTTPDVSGAKLNREDFTLNAGESFQMTVSGTTAAPAWSVKDAAVATVSESGMVKAVGAGDTMVYAKVGDRTLECIVRVKGGSSSGSGGTVDVSAAKLNKTDFTISVGEKTQLKVTGTTASVTWSIGNSAVASIASDGTVKGLKAGTTTAYAKVGSKTLECIVRVK